MKVNNDLGYYFRTYKGLRQGDPLSPLLFDLVGDILAHLVNKAQELGLIKGMNSHLVDGGLAILQYADDTIFFFLSRMI